MQQLPKKNNYELFLLFVLVLLSRIPFLGGGYGIEEDSWGIALAAFHTHVSGVYEPSRLPGHPGQEYLLSLLWGIGSYWFNFLSAVFGAVAAVYFAKILKKLAFKQYWLAALAFSFIPVFYISSTYTIDFVWTEAFVLMSLYALMNERFLISGVWLGLAITCRITSGAMFLPFMILLWDAANLKQTFRRLITIMVPVTIITVIFFLPIYWQFGPGFFMYYDQFPYPSIAKVFYKMIPGVFGFIGCVAIGFFSLIALFRKRKWGQEFSAGLPNTWLYVIFSILILYSISYFRLPQKSGYMLPVLPFVILLFAYQLSRRQFLIFSICLMVSSFLFAINLTDKLRGSAYSAHAVKFTVSGQELFLDPFSGPIQADLSKRNQKTNYLLSVEQISNRFTRPTVVIAGWWYNQLTVDLIDKEKNSLVEFVGYANEKDLQHFKEQGKDIYFLPEQNEYNDLMFRMRVTDQLASPFPS